MQMSIGKRIRECREGRMTQSQLATAMGVSRTQVHKWESGRDQPSGDRLPKLAKLFDVSIEWLLEGKTKARYLDFTTKLTSEPPQPKEFKRVKFSEIQIVPLPEFGELKVIEVKASADFNPTFAPQIDTVSVDKRLVSQNHYGMMIKGHSMSPTIREGDVVVVSRQGWMLEEFDPDRGPALKHEWKKLHRKIVVCSINDEEPICKRVYITDLPGSPQGFFMQLGSDNCEAPPIAVWKKDRVIVYGIVVASVRDLYHQGIE